MRYDIHRLPELVFKCATVPVGIDCFPLTPLFSLSLLLSMMGFTAFQQLAAFHARRQSHYSDALNNIVM